MPRKERSYIVEIDLDGTIKDTLEVFERRDRKIVDALTDDGFSAAVCESTGVHEFTPHSAQGPERITVRQLAPRVKLRKVA